MLDRLVQLFSPVLFLALPALLIGVFVDRMPPPRWLSKKVQLIGRKNPESITSHECPYAYIREIYGKHHWAPFVNKLSPTLRTDDPVKYKTVLETMDTLHLCLMLVDDVGPWLLTLNTSLKVLFTVAKSNICSSIDLRRQRPPQRPTNRTQNIRLLGDRQPRILPRHADLKQHNTRLSSPRALADAGS